MQSRLRWILGSAWVLGFAWVFVGCGDDTTARDAALPDATADATLDGGGRDTGPDGFTPDARDDAGATLDCFAANDDRPEGVYEVLPDGSRGTLVEACADNFRCVRVTLRCERVLGDAPTGAPCVDDLDCAGTDAFPGRCLTEVGGMSLDGICAHECAADTDCDSGHCAFMDASSGRGSCALDCDVLPDSGPCPAPLVCVDGDDDDVGECLQLGAVPARVGTPCTGAFDCRGDGRSFCLAEDAFWRGGYCLITGCASDADCVAGSHCGFYGEPGVGTCVASCAADGSCERAGYTCRDLDTDGRPECAPSGTGSGGIGARCESIDDCAGGARASCLQPAGFGAAGGYCTLGCDDAADCPSGSVCTFRNATGRGTCLGTCTTDSDCGAGRACADRDFDDVRECGPPGDGPLDVGEACATADQCGTGPLVVCLGGINFGGVCSARCAGDADCPATSQCVAAGEPANGYCLRACASGADCAAPLATCTDFDGDGRTECAPFGGGLVATGARCAEASVCAGGDGAFCTYPDFVCTRFCAADASCGAGAHCVSNAPRGARLCRASCASDAECEMGLRCVDLDGDERRECAGVGQGVSPVGASCGGPNTCDRANALFCRFDQPGGLCTRSCDPTSPCPDGSRCGSVYDGGPRLCLASCASDAECRGTDGWRCVDADGDGASECRPSGVGAGALGTTCRSVRDCAGGAGAVCAAGPNATDGICSRGCATQACPSGSHCVELPPDGLSVCLPDCVEAAMCAVGSTCVQTDALGPMECLDACTSDADCRFSYAARSCVEARGVCVECGSTADCAAGSACVDDRCIIP